MQIVIDIPNENYVDDIVDELDDFLTDYFWGTVCKIIPLPKGHGRLIDADRVIKKMEEREEKLKDDRSIWETAGVETALNMFGETIIEAESEE